MFSLAEKIMFGVFTVVIIGLLIWAIFEGVTANDVSLNTVTTLNTKTTLNNAQTILRML